jgi:SEC-C motif-containing protein
MPYINGDQPAPSAEALMRSRYTAYVLQDETYILSTWHASTRPLIIPRDTEPPSKWLSLEILDCTNDSVEFIARYKVKGKAYKLHEKSRFTCEGKHWYYIDGEIKSST